ncbi:hypothetical protein PN441_01835 [Spirulina major CS-329]|jgi:hypothetical protein|uniref:hypothetical protein n=1 Tax=Spirulina TaxID=1154 RepID=UPI00232AA13D|nr:MULTISPECIES: hypothetical protein [Spirulina]MDB9494672.1 hypothetical protein [Spirulina subsalsa CS-330]MDB9501795.1 hypothetical protein [Spirulina major CS-329]
MTSPVNPDDLPLEHRIAYCLETGQISRQTYFQFVTYFLSDTSATSQERQGINQILDNVQTGHITFIVS